MRKWGVRVCACLAFVAGLAWSVHYGAIWWTPEWRLIELAHGQTVLQSWAHSTVEMRWAYRRQREQRRSAQQRAAIEAEIATLDDHPWAGVYMDLDRPGPAIWLAPREGYVAPAWAAAPPLKIPRIDFSDYGRIEPLTDGKLRLHTAVNPDVGVIPRTAVYYFKWAERDCVVLGAQIWRFINACNAGRGQSLYYYERSRAFGAVQSPYSVPGPGQPELPTPFRRYLHEVPETAQLHIYEVWSDYRRYRPTVMYLGPKLVGRGRGALRFDPEVLRPFVGMQLYAHPDGDLRVMATVTDAEQGLVKLEFDALGGASIEDFIALHRIVLSTRDVRRRNNFGEWE